VAECPGTPAVEVELGLHAELRLFSFPHPVQVYPAFLDELVLAVNSDRVAVIWASIHPQHLL